MAIIPLKQAVVVEPFAGTDPDWNELVYGTPYYEDCRFQEAAKLVRNQRGDEVVSVGTFIFDKLPIISINDRLTYTNENGTVRTYTPIAISVRRALNGKPLLTEVDV
ncbi:hypothetical protein [Paenibacillus terrigena]|uniref:hypothetical protein n=1 Tax=Paenibacillus terrigena TaxID=369333 RepID=UPI00037EB315|nr:hypothetical protein [Paenibacillus terrigena]